MRSTPSDGRKDGTGRARAALSVVRSGAERVVWNTSSRLSGHASSDGSTWCRVMAGPIRGSRLGMPRRERLSYVVGTYESHVVRAMRDHVRAGMTVYDIGAHIGYLSLTLGRLVGPRGTVIAVEADPRNRAMLRANLDANDATNVTVVGDAVSDAVGVISFTTFPTYSSVGHISEGVDPDDAVLVDVPATTIDELAFGSRYRAPAFIKVDVEGAETRVFRGAERTLRELRPTIICEARRGETLDELTALATHARYDLKVIDANTALASAGVVDVLFTPRT